LSGVESGLGMVVCPVCHGSVMAGQDGDAVRCVKCGRIYPVVDGIPVLIAARASGDFLKRWET
jgi:uncharacterized protein YbaR (Trm112 family)